MDYKNGIVQKRKRSEEKFVTTNGEISGKWIYIGWILELCFFMHVGAFLGYYCLKLACCIYCKHTEAFIIDRIRLMPFHWGIHGAIYGMVAGALIVILIKLYQIITKNQTHKQFDSKSEINKIALTDSNMDLC